MPLKVASTQRARQAQFESTVVEYLSIHNGHFVVLSQDASFLTLLRLTLLKELRQNHNTSLTHLSDPKQLVATLKQVCATRTRPVVFFEHMLKGSDLTFLVQQCKSQFDIYAIILTSSPEKNQLMFMHEMGADNFITKPMSTNTLITKLATTLRPQSRFAVQVNKAKQFFEENRFDECLQYCHEILMENPASAVVHLIMGDALKAKGRIDLALEYYQLASTNAEFYLDPLRRLADLSNEEGDTTKQLSYLKRLDTLSPLNVHRKLDMGAIHLHLGQPDEAERLLTTVTNQISKEPTGLVSPIIGRIASLYSQKDPAQAETYLRNLIKSKNMQLSFEDIQLFNQLGISLRLQGKWKEALIEYGNAVKIDPRDENLHYNMGMACVDGKEYHEAQKHMLKALDLNARLPYSAAIIALNIGKVFYMNNTHKKAMDCLNIALELNPQLSEARKLLARLAEIKRE